MKIRASFGIMIVSGLILSAGCTKAPEQKSETAVTFTKQVEVMEPVMLPISSI